MARLLAVTALLASLIAAQSCNGGGPQYNSVTNYGGPKQCVPSGYTQAQDFGYTTQSQLQDKCGQACQNMPNCGGFIGQLQKAGDSNLATGQCFYYTQIPAAPTTCANPPTVIFAQAKDKSYSCLTSSASQATAYCSRYLSLGTVTSYTSTYTPTLTVTTTSTSSSFSTSTSISTSISTTTATSSVTVSSSTIVTSTSTSTVYTYNFNLVARSVQPQARAVTPSPPACLNTQSIPASRISSACSCLSITSTTLRTVSTAQVTTTTLTIPASTTTTTTTTTTFQTTTTPTTIGTTTTISTTTAAETSTVQVGTSYFQLMDPNNGDPRFITIQTSSRGDWAAVAFNHQKPATCYLAADRHLRCDGHYGGMSTQYYQYRLINNFDLATGDSDEQFSLQCNIGSDLSLTCDPYQKPGDGTTLTTLYYISSFAGGGITYDVAGKTYDSNYGVNVQAAHFKAVPVAPPS